MLWEDAGGPHHTVCVQQVVLCELLLVSPSTLNRTLKAMVKEGRMVQLTTEAGPTPRTYEVADPRTMGHLSNTI